MDVLHATWFWVAVIAAPAIALIGTLARLARKEPPIKLPSGVAPLRWDDDEEDAPSGEAKPPVAGNGDRVPPKH
ncbi:hypothetical protein KIF53_06645 [Chromobacterium subtsugae]|uniref:Uncharacterized protein n=1 Tax=Chromobacterium subtsugae TaxID=251747 RepID=A0ABS7FDD5_9NEIS|nr:MULTISPECIES: hypothetical protein [Chromobacterium]KUM03899.1 hypothetical protein Cv017_17225 [Chromobacterium subtsugae]KZE84496.1 hypothetical protein AWB61_03605 [Chromobacterium sp. F49]MBW7566183.1 hypothetical protein [Chromobacterium subtsugae]MBW8287304.1 hypothetical protein [Chromobacterium subtsugae]OBU87456.1 hypothetical protein MY55_04680 [Chromobacterium subtsugae]